MGFLEAYKSFWKNYVNFNGRASRSAYWYATLWNVIIVIIFYVLAFMFGLSLAMEKVMAGYEIVGFGSLLFILFVLWLFMLAILLPTISLTVRRLHDSGKSGFFAFLNFIPFVGGIIMLVFMCLESDGPNQYGDGNSEFDI